MSAWRRLRRYRVIRPFLDQDTFQTELARTEGIAVRTVRRWIERYRKFGLAGLARKFRRDKATRRLSTSLAEVIEGLALGKPRPSVATVHRKAILAAERLGEPPPSYAQVRAVVRGLSPGLLVLAHEGSKAYCDTFDLLYRREAERPNAIWQADHSEVDVLVKDDGGKPRKPWLTVVIDDYSRAVAGYLLFFGAPSAIQTALASARRSGASRNPAGISAASHRFSIQTTAAISPPSTWSRCLLTSRSG